MPGKKDSSIPGASYISDWYIYRSQVAANDAIDTIPHIQAITDVIDMSRNDKGFDNQIWVHPNRTAGTGTVTLSLYKNNNGSWGDVISVVLEDQQTGQADKGIFKWTGLLAGIYRIAITAMDSGAKWDLHVAHT
jgi:hypothetical protein